MSYGGGRRYGSDTYAGDGTGGTIIVVPAAIARAVVPVPRVQTGVMRVSQETVEPIVARTDRIARVTQNPVEPVVHDGFRVARITQMYVEVVVVQGGPGWGWKGGGKVTWAVI